MILLFHLQLFCVILSLRKMEKQKSERGGLKTSMIEVCSVIIYDFSIVFFYKVVVLFFFCREQ